MELAVATSRSSSSTTCASTKATRPPPETTREVQVSEPPGRTGARKLTFISALAEKTFRPWAQVTVAAPMAESHMAATNPPWRSPAGLVNRSSAGIRHTVRPGSLLSTHTIPRVRSQLGGTCILRAGTPRTVADGRVGSVPFAAAMSEHPVTAHAVGEAAGEVLERVGERPDLALLFVTAPHAGALEDAAGVVDEVLHPLVLLGCAAESVAGPHREVEHSAAVTLFAGRTGPLLPLVLEVVPEGTDGTATLSGWPEEPAFEPQGLVLLADPYSFPAEPVLEWLDARHPGMAVVGGMASAGRGPGGNRMVLGRGLRTSGAVGALLGPGVELETVVSQGCRPFGHPLVVTRAEGNVIFELAGRPALERLVAQAHETLSEDEVRLLEAGGLHIGRVIDEHREHFGRGDFLVRNVVGADRSSGAIAVGDQVSVGTTVQFHLRDAASADEDLRAMLHGRQADGALLFTCNGRGTRLFDGPDHDVAALADELGRVPVAGFFAAGELGPVGQRNFVHGFTASVALLRDGAATS